MADGWKPPEWADSALQDDGGSFLNEKKRHTGKGKKKKQEPKKAKKKKKKPKTPTTPVEPESFPEPEPEPEKPQTPVTPEPVQITYQDWLLSALKTLDISELDTNGNGMIELNEFQAYFKEVNPDLAETIFYDIDADKDKYITTYEYETWKASLTEESLQILRDNYQKYPEPEPEPEEKEPSPEPPPEPEPEPVYEPPPPQPKPEPVKRVVYTKSVDDSSLLSILKTMDYESLGSNGKIHWIDFRNAVQKFNTINVSNEDLLKIFNDIDRNRDQYISYNEYKIWINKLNSLLLEQILKQQQYQQYQQPVQQRPKVVYYNNIDDTKIDTGSLLSFLKTMNAKSLDTNNDNSIQYNEMVGYFKRFYTGQISDDAIRKIFLDINNNMGYNRVNLDDFNKWIGRLNSLHLDKVLKGAATGNNNNNNNNNNQPKVKYYNNNPNNNAPKVKYYNNEPNNNNNAPKVKYYNNDPNKNNFNNNNQQNGDKPQGYLKPFSLSQSDIKELLGILQNLNIRSLDYGNTNTVPMDVFQGYFKNRNGREIPGAIVNKIWYAIDTQKVGRIAVGEYQRFLNGLNEDKLKYVCTN